eukprot:2669928-Pleurochrysis_carterae.AAC.6
MRSQSSTWSTAQPRNKTHGAEAAYERPPRKGGGRGGHGPWRWEEADAKLFLHAMQYFVPVGSFLPSKYMDLQRCMTAPCEKMRIHPSWFEAENSPPVHMLA